jgi:hypothetical protein
MATGIPSEILITSGIVKAAFASTISGLAESLFDFYANMWCERLHVLPCI